MYNRRIDFQEVRGSATKYGACPGCGKRLRRSKTFIHTVNPFNRNDDGTVRTIEQVREHLREVVVAWHDEPCYCADYPDCGKEG